jgi:hypothetical protein
MGANRSWRWVLRGAPRCSICLLCELTFPATRFFYSPFYSCTRFFARPSNVGNPHDDDTSASVAACSDIRGFKRLFLWIRVLSSWQDSFSSQHCLSAKQPLLITVAGSRRKWLSSILLPLLLCWIPSCGSGSGGGGHSFLWQARMSFRGMLQGDGHQLIQLIATSNVSLDPEPEPPCSIRSRFR